MSKNEFNAQAAETLHALLQSLNDGQGNPAALQDFANMQDKDAQRRIAIIVQQNMVDNFQGIARLGIDFEAALPLLPPAGRTKVADAAHNIVELASATDRILDKDTAPVITAFLAAVDLVPIDEYVHGGAVMNAIILAVKADNSPKAPGPTPN